MPRVVVTRLRAKPGCEQRLADALRALIEQERAETGSDAPRYVLARSWDDSAVFELRECYEDDSAPDFVGDGAQTSVIDQLAGLIDCRPILEGLLVLDSEV